MSTASMPSSPVIVVLASGRGERFTAAGGIGYKLHAPMAGSTVLEHTLAAVRASGLPWHLEDAGHPGMGDSIAAAVRATAGAGGWLILPADLPLVQPATLQTVARALAGTSQAAQPHYRGARGHPVAFAANCGLQLAALSGNQGAAPILRALRDAQQVVEVEVDDVGIVTDIDTPEELARAEALMLERLSRA
ncbi:NTP transferase domain-containing protein [Variovorax sp. J22R24]|uniref:nucleotidyltransferase family protein n=1 Tax=Variovorax gracilis TaxID=3053502 RepID=UPI00257584D1|nr:NTP transferase domain-containing protein [Variovorax sp. J22R24]MDM0104225.1 NTP transferase domain-containing protein [Variovorax sp. J22R24]